MHGTITYSNEFYETHSVIKAVKAVALDTTSIEIKGLEHILIDSAKPGSGSTFDWNAVNTDLSNKRLFVAGGLNSNNVEDAIKLFTPYAVDVSSGIETNGRKDINKITQFIQSVRGGTHEL